MKNLSPKDKTVYLLSGVIVGIIGALAIFLLGMTVKGRLAKVSQEGVYGTEGFSGQDKKTPASPESESGEIILTVNATQVLRPISPLIYGSNLDPKTEFEMDVAGFAKDIGITNFRFPGGGSPGYHWQEGRFDYYERVNEAPLAKLENVIKFSQLAGATLVIQVNIESGTPEEAAQWVEHMNKKGAMRVDYWELGNEIYGDWDKAYMTGEEYGKKIKEYSAAMKKIDPTIKIGANWGGSNYAEFNKGFLLKAADDIDFLSIHWYPNHIGPHHEYKGRKHPYPEEIMANSTAVRNLVNYANEKIKQYAPQRSGKIEMAILEWDGSWDAVSSDLEYTFKGMMWSLANAIFYADSLGQFAVNGITLANQYNLQEVMFGLIRGWDRQAGWGGSRWDGQTIRPKALALKLFARYFGDALLQTSLNKTPTYYKEKDWRADSFMGDVPILTAYASRVTNQKKIAIALINKHSSRDYKVRINLEGVTPKKEGKAWILNGPELKSQNDGQPAAVAIGEFAVKDISKSFYYTVAAHSVNMLQIDFE